jgi:hypothetical protein
MTAHPAYQGRVLFDAVTGRTSLECDPGSSRGQGLGTVDEVVAAFLAQTYDEPSPT